MRRTYKFKAKLSKTTEYNANRWLYLCQQLYNACLEQRITVWNSRKHGLHKYSQIKELPDLKKELPEFKEVGSQVLYDVIFRVSKSYDLFFSRLKTDPKKAGLPRFKSRDRYKSFTLTQAGWKLEGRHLKIKGVGTFKLFLSREIEGRIKTVTVKKDSCGDWFVYFSCDNVPFPEYKSFQEDAVGLDVGISSFLTDSEGNQVDNPKFFRKTEKELRRKQRVLSRRKKGSSGRKKARKLVAKQHRKVTRQREDFLFKTAKQYIDKYALIAVENLKISNMVKNHNLAKSISDAGWHKFKQILIFKAEEAGRQLVEVKPHGTSQNCSGCGMKVEKDLSVRVHDCSHCGLRIDRDRNAALNILKSAVGQTVWALTWDNSPCVV